MFRKLILLLFCCGTLLYAGTITDPVGDKSTGDTYTAAEFNALKNAIITEINGNLDANNLKNNAVTTEKITADSVTPAKIDDDNTTPVTVRELAVTTGVTASTVTVTTATLTNANITNVQNTPTFNYGLTGTTMTLTEQPCCRVYLSGDQDDPGAGSAIVQFDTESYDVASNFDTGTSSFTSTIAGYYQVNATIFYEAADLNDNEYVGVAIRKNSSEYSISLANAAGGTYDVCASISEIIPLAVGDTLSLYHYTSDANVDIESGAAYTTMSIRLVQ